jgi:eukaryotic-like serine/threonine-protein kinase
MIQELPKDVVLGERYKIIKLLGRGDFGLVYQACDQKGDQLTHRCVGEYVAIKQMPMQMIVDCERQADLRALLVHPAIPRIYSYFVTEEYSYLVMQLIDGWDLEAYLLANEFNLAEAEVVSWAIQICDALDYLHNHPYYPIIFRDLKPNNLMVDRDGKIFLVDFGLVRAYPPHFFQEAMPQFEHLWKGLAIGTEGYSPPEQYRGYVTPQSDLYALGASLHHLLTGCDPRQEPPFTFYERPVRRLNPAVSPALEAVVMRALENTIERRFSSAREMKEALEALHP